MQITNNFTESVIVFLYVKDHLTWPLVVGAPILLANAAFAQAEETLAPGQATTSLRAPSTNCFIGVKREGFAGSGRLGPFLSAPTRDLPDDTAVFEVTPMGELVWVNRPSVPDPTPQLSTSDLTNPLPKATGYVVGVGKATVFDPAAADKASKVSMQGWANPDQTSIEMDECPLYARAFIVGDPKTQQRVVMVVADIWSCSIALKEAVIERLQRGSAEVPYRTDNIFIAGTHTHSAHAGFLHHLLYNFMAGGFDPHVFECYVRGIVRAIELAHEDLASGAVYIKAGNIRGLTRNRSLAAFALNPATDRNVFPRNVDEKMTLLKFVHRSSNANAPEIAIGMLNWFAIHPTNLGAKNALVSGDNKGWAEAGFELDVINLPDTRKPFVGAFGNSACGDVSGNFKTGTPLDEFDPPISDADEFRDRMKATARTQSDEAMKLFTTATEELTGPLGFRHQRLDLPKRTGAPGALGLSMPAGSTEDGGPGIGEEGLQLTDPQNPSVINRNQVVSQLLQPVMFVAYGVLSVFNMLLHPLDAFAHWNAVVNTTPLGVGSAFATIAAHFPKPILMVPGAIRPTPLTPNIMPIQLLRIGPFALLGVPAEVSTVSGLRLRKAVTPELARREVRHIVVGAYANGYASYITTKEEYESQQYEGASTLFGPGTCSAFERAFGELAKALIDNTIVRDDAPQPNLSNDVMTKRRMTFRNLSAAPERFRLYFVPDESYQLVLWPGADFVVEPGAERAVVVPFPFSMFLEQVQVVLGSDRLGPSRPPARFAFPLTSDLIVVDANGAPITSPYFPTAR